MAVRAAKNSEAKLAEILESTLDAIVVIDSARRIKLFNQAAEHIFGRSVSDAMHQAVDRLLSKPFRKLLRDFLNTAGVGTSNPQLWAPQGLTAILPDGTEFPV